MKHSTQIGSLNYYFNYFWENFVIGFKSVVEYRANLLAGFTILTFFYIMYTVLGSILISNFRSVINWKIEDFIVFFLICDIIQDTSGLFWRGKFLKYQIFELKIFNRFLTMPGNKFLNYTFYNPPNFMFFDMFHIISLLIVCIFFSSYEFNIFYTILIIFMIVLLIILNTTLVQFIISISWRFLELGESTYNLFDEISRASRRFPATFIQNSKIKYLFYLSHGYFVATLIIPLVNGIIPTYFTQYLLIIFSLITISIIGTILNWNYGLKRYEAFS